MQSKKPKKNYKIALLLPNYGRPEYARKCIKSIRKDRCDYELVIHHGKDGLRNAIIDFFEKVRGKYDFIAKLDNDCTVPAGWMDHLIWYFENSDLDIISPNVHPSNAAYVYGKDDKNKIYRPSDIVGGLWCMKASLIDDLEFVRYPVEGITGAIAILKQIRAEKEPVIGWAADVVVQDIGHWSGTHPEHIKSADHLEYSNAVGRDVAWSL